MKLKLFVLLMVLLGGFVDLNVAQENSSLDPSVSPTGDFIEGEEMLDATCEIAAFVADRTSGVNIRESPGLSSRVLKTIPPDAGGALAFIEGSQGDWLLVSSVINSKKTKIFNGAGWIYAPLLAVKFQSKGGESVEVYASPDKSRSLGVRNPSYEPTLLGCKGDWVKASFPLRGSEKGEEIWIPRGSWCGTPWGDCM